MTVDDLAAEAEQFGLEMALKHRYPSLSKVGKCHNCGAGVGVTASFCAGGECKEDYERRILNRLGK